MNFSYLFSMFAIVSLVSLFMIFLWLQQHQYSISRNALIPLHNTLVSLPLATLLGSFLLSIFIYMHLISFILTLFINPVSSILILYYVLSLWLNNLILETNMGNLTMTELSCISLGFIIFIISEIMVFLALFWCYLNGWIQCSIYIFYSFPPLYILPIIPFTLPLSNLLILYFSSIPLQSSVLFLKTGYRLQCIEGIGQNILCGLIFMVLQFKEYIYSYFDMSFSSYGTIFYMITGLHGIHVCLGIVIYYILMILSFLSYFWFFGFNASVNTSINSNNSISILTLQLLFIYLCAMHFSFSFLCNLFTFNLNWIPRSSFSGYIVSIVAVLILWCHVTLTYSILGLDLGFELADSISRIILICLLWIPDVIYINHGMYNWVNNIMYDNVSIFYIEYHLCYQLLGNYWHFVDCLWFIVLLLVYC